MPTFFPGLTDFLHPPSFIHSPLSLRCHNRRVSGLFSHKCHVLIMYTLHREPSMLCYRLASALLFSQQDHVVVSCTSRRHGELLPDASMSGAPTAQWSSPGLSPLQSGSRVHISCRSFWMWHVFTKMACRFFSPATLVTSLFIRSSLRRTSLSLGQACAFQSNGPK